MKTWILLFFLVAISMKAGERPNFILLMGDDHGWSETGYNGHPYLQTPVLDEIAESGLRLDRFYAAHPTCSPTRGSFLTGRHPNRYGTFTPNWSIRPEEITMAHLLGKSGYHCGHFGKWHVGPVKADSPTSPGAMGFQEYLSHDNFYEMDPPLSRNGAPPEILKGEGSIVTIDETIKFIEGAREKEKPFLAVVWFGSPHEPYSGLPEDLAPYDDLPEEYSKRSVKLTSNETGQQVKRPLRDVLRERYTEITAMDRAIGQLREFLDEAGLRENTVLWYCGDNGSPPSSGRVTTPFREEKGHVHEGGIRVPGLIEWPAKISNARTTSFPSVTSDMLPTLCELAGIPATGRPLDGISIVPMLNGDLEERPQPIFFWEYRTDLVTNRDPAPQPWIDPTLQEGTTPLVKFLDGKRTRSFINFRHHKPTEEDYGGPRVNLGNRYKLVLGADKGAEVELFDIKNDPAETKNLAKTMPKVVQSMKADLKTWQESVLHSLQGNDYP
ncbi:MAG: sulfatase-like hydrolase/transferase [Verrucomicrobiota bacterium]